MKILALEPYYGGSHKAFLDNWSKQSSHKWTLLTLPPYKWKWRMRHSAITFAQEINSRAYSGESWDVIWCSDMLNLSEFLGMTRKTTGNIPTVAYFHENQLSYPVQYKDERDYHFVVNNMTTAATADAVWFNSDFHRQEFLKCLKNFLVKMPDFQPLHLIDDIDSKSSIHPQGISQSPTGKQTKRDEITILWAARWEFDKNPECFFEAIRLLRERGAKFKINVIGEQFMTVPVIFKKAETEFAEEINRWGFQPSLAEYENALLESDIVVSTAIHEFFGISVVEAVDAGCYPILPERLAYPEIFNPNSNNFREKFYYDGSPEMLCDRLESAITTLSSSPKTPSEQCDAQEIAENYHWEKLVPVMDNALRTLLK